MPVPDAESPDEPEFAGEPDAPEGLEMRGGAEPGSKGRIDGGRLELRLEPARLAPGLHVVATPIGNLGDVTLRALATLAGVDTILAEDTRMTRRLLGRYGITTPLEPYHEHNAERVRPAVLARLGEGARIAIVSDAGTPLISDPGFKLVEAALSAGIKVTGAPGASAVLAALMIAGLPTDRFFFEGFLPQKQAARRARLAEIATVPGTLVIFESPRRLAEMLADAATVLGDRQAAVTRELTKLYEEVRRGSLAELTDSYAREDTPKGEIVVLIGAAGETAKRGTAAEDLDTLIVKALEGHSLKEAVARVAADTGLPRRQVYARALELSSRD